MALRQLERSERTASLYDHVKQWRIPALVACKAAFDPVQRISKQSKAPEYGALQTLREFRAE